jgi:hypothetical protein
MVINDRNKNRPLYKVDPKIKRSINPLDLLNQTYSLNESEHVYMKDNKEYNKLIINTYNMAIDDYFNGDKPLYKIYNNFNLEYVYEEILYLTPYIDKVQIFFTINKNTVFGDAISLTIPEYNNINSDYYPLYIGNERHIELCTIIVDLPDLWNIKTPINEIRKLYKNNTQLIGIINHEIIHIMHDLINTNLSYKNGDAYYYADMLCKVFGEHCVIPNVYDLNIINQKSVYNISDMYKTISSCIYYTDKSELSAWQETFNSYDVFYMEHYNKEYNDINNRMPYKLYKILYNIVNKNKLYIIDHILDNNDCYNIIIEWMKSMNYNKFEISNIINKWIKNIQGYLDRCIKIHEINYMKL